LTTVALAKDVAEADLFADLIPYKIQKAKEILPTTNCQLLYALSPQLFAMLNLRNSARCTFIL